MVENKNRKLSFQARLFIVFSIALLVVSTFSLFGLVGMQKLSKTTTEITDSWLPGVQVSAELRLKTQAIRALQWELVHQKDSQKRAGLVEQIETLQGELFIYTKSMSRLNHTSRSQSIFDRYQVLWSEYSDKHETLLKEISENKSDSATTLLSGDMAVIFEKLQTSGKELDDIFYRGSQTAKDSAQKRARQTLFMSLFGLPSCIAISLVLAWLTTQRVTRLIINLANRLKQSAYDVEAQGDSLAAAATELSQVTTEEASALTETAATVENIKEKVERNAEMAQATALAIASTREQALDGQKSIHKVIQAVDDIESGNSVIVEHVEASSRSLEDINLIMKSIEEKTTVINDIVFKTRLLSFNASVEAARAGMHGQGFAVVAEEIANLANVSGIASKEISVILEKSSETVNSIVRQTRERVSAAVKDSGSQIVIGKSLIENCSAMLTEIVATADKANALAREISQATSEQAQGIKEINSAITALTSTVDQNSSLAEETSKNSRNLRSQAAELTRVSQLIEIELKGKSVTHEPTDSDWPQDISEPSNSYPHRAA